MCVWQRARAESRELLLQKAFVAIQRQSTAAVTAAAAATSDEVGQARARGVTVLWVCLCTIEQKTRVLAVAAAEDAQ